MSDDVKRRVIEIVREGETMATFEFILEGGASRLELRESNPFLDHRQVEELEQQARAIAQLAYRDLLAYVSHDQPGARDPDLTP